MFVSIGDFLNKIKNESLLRNDEDDQYAQIQKYTKNCVSPGWYDQQRSTYSLFLDSVIQWENCDIFESLFFLFKIIRTDDLFITLLLRYKYIQM